MLLSTVKLKRLTFSGPPARQLTSPPALVAPTAAWRSEHGAKKVHVVPLPFPDT
jgi:hypothetical protein